MDVLSLLRSKNRCLQNFLQASIDFLNEANSDPKELPDVVAFESRRETILRAIDLFDRKVSEAVSLLGSESPSPALTESIRTALDEKTALVHRILETDEQVLSLIEAEKNRVLKEISSTQKNEEIARRFRSTWVPESGEGIDEKL